MFNTNLRPYTKQWLEELCKESTSYRQVLEKAGRSQGGSTSNTLKKKIQEFNIDISHFNIKNQNDREKYSLEEVFCKNSPVTQKMLRGYITRHNILEYKCEKCGCDGHWQNGIISLEIDHINGDNKDNRIENLHYLCPNCHALTETYRGRNIGRSK